MAEEMVQRVASQMSGALSHLHALGFVHRDVKPENIFLCDQTCQWVKLGDFGMTKPKGAQVPGVWYESPYCVPEVEMAKGRKEQRVSNGKNLAGKEAKGIGAAVPGTSTKSKEGAGEKTMTFWVSVEVGIDSWALGILVYSLLTGCYPWKETSSDDPGYRKYKDWLDSERTRRPDEKGEDIKWKGQDLGRAGWSDEGGCLECSPMPPQFEVFTPLAWSLFKGLLSPQPHLRTTPEDVLRYLGSTWLLTKGEVEKTLSDKGKEKEKEKGGRT